MASSKSGELPLLPFPPYSQSNTAAARISHDFGAAVDFLACLGWAALSLLRDLEGKLVNDACPQHPLGIVSLSIPISGTVALANSLDGTTILHSLDGSAPPTTHESFLEHVSNRDGQDFATADDEPSVSRTTWAVSLHPDEKVFAASGAGGKLGIRAATPAGQEGETFGKLLRELDSGREKFGLNVKFVGLGRSLCYSTGVADDFTCFAEP